MSEPIRLVVSDVDGTLVDDQKRLTQPTVDAVRRLRDAGIAFTVISARPRSGLIPIADALDIDLPMGAFNGGTVFRRDGTLLDHRLLEPDLVRTMLAMASDAPVDIWVFADDRWYASTDEGHHVGSERIASNQPPIVTADFSALYGRADKLTFVSDEPGILETLGDRARPLMARASIVQSQSYYLDVTATLANKGDGISALSAVIGVPLSATMAIGDQANDLPMFARVGLSVAMGQGPEAVRARADKVTRGNDEDGVAAAIAALLGD